ncbi:MAG: hypothetical protein HOE53_00680 [Candidatus Magasanikbacteria bacterium]|jgi:processive 1,2-diacylglycerol beta-glucosyltransferase|nr:hypothetical protein [Candidatus Magasanikbacteria bacterium]
MKKKKVLIVSVSAGSGHVRAAQAIEQAAAAFPNAKVQHIDMMDYVSAPLKTTIVDVYEQLIKRAPQLWRYLYDKADETNRMNQFYSLSKSVNRVNARAFYAFVSSFKPDHVICTHSFPAQVLRQAKDPELHGVPVSLVVTDYGLHRFWIVSDVAQYFVATKKIAWELQQHGVNKKSIVVSGIPVDAAFAKRANQKQMRTTLGLPEKKTVLIMGGGVGSVQMDDIVSLLRDQKDSKPLHVIAIAGKNEKLLKRLRAQEKIKSPVSISAFGWSNNIAEFMEAADIVVTKSGGLTTSECIARKRMMVVVEPVPGQEERNAEFILEHGLGLVARSAADLLYALTQKKEYAPTYKVQPAKAAATIMKRVLA